MHDLDTVTKWMRDRQLVTDGFRSGRVFGYVASLCQLDALVEMFAPEAPLRVRRCQVPVMTLRPLGLKPAPQPPTEEPPC